MSKEAGHTRTAAPPHGRSIHGRVRRALLAVTVRLCGCAAVPAVLHAQVGHEPSRSPFRDIVTRQHLTLFGGRFAGHRTVPGVGARPGAFFGIRIETRLSGPLDLSVSVASVGSTRRVVNPLLPPDSLQTDSTAPRRESGPVDYTLVAADAALSLNLTGAKTWHGLAPYLAFGLGIVTPTGAVTDPGGYHAGTNFTLVPTVGVRYYLGRRVALRVDARDYYFRYEWPLSYFSPIDPQGNAVPGPVLPIEAREVQWTHNFNLAVGLTYAFTF